MAIRKINGVRIYRKGDISVPVVKAEYVAKSYERVCVNCSHRALHANKAGEEVNFCTNGRARVSSDATCEEFAQSGAVKRAEEKRFAEFEAKVEAWRLEG